MKGLRVAKGVRGVEFEGVWGELQSGAGFRGQWLAGCLEVALFFVWGGVRREGFNFCFSGIFS